jgi:hypothetical protein
MILDNMHVVLQTLGVNIHGDHGHGGNIKSIARYRVAENLCGVTGGYTPLSRWINNSIVLLFINEAASRIDTPCHEACASPDPDLEGVIMVGLFGQRVYVTPSRSSTSPPPSRSSPTPPHKIWKQGSQSPQVFKESGEPAEIFEGLDKNYGENNALAIVLEVNP